MSIWGNKKSINYKDDLEVLIEQGRKYRDKHWSFHKDRLEDLIERTRYFQLVCDDRFAFNFFITIYDLYVVEEYRLAMESMNKFYLKAADFKK